MGRLIAKILAWLAILLGLALLIQPTAAQWWTSTRNAKTAAQFAARAEAQPTAPAAEETTAEPPEPERAYPELYAAMQDYNAEIYAGGQSGLTDPFAYEEAPLDLAAYGYDDDVLAVGNGLWLRRGFRTGFQLRPLQRAVGGGEKLRIAYGLQQIVDGVVAESVESIFLEGGDKDDAAFRRNDFRKLYAVELRHLNVEKKQVYLLLQYAFYCLRGGCERCLKRQKRCLFDKRAYQPACERFVVDGDAFNHGR